MFCFSLSLFGWTGFDFVLIIGFMFVFLTFFSLILYSLDISCSSSVVLGVFFFHFLFPFSLYEMKFYLFIFFILEKRSQYIVRHCAKQSGWCVNMINKIVNFYFIFFLIFGSVEKNFKVLTLKRLERRGFLKKESLQENIAKTKPIRNLHTATLCYQCRSCRVTRSRWA
jgi:hypothetical protein